MADPLNARLEVTYAAAADEARRTVAAAFDLHRVGTVALPASVTKTRFRDVWRVRLPDGAPAAHLLVAIPWVFPDELPDLYVPEDLTFQGARIPHIDGFRQVCTLDDTTRFPNPAQPGESVLELVDRAIQIIRDGLAGRNRAEYWDEFEAYWIDGAKNLTTAISIVRPDGAHREIVMARLVPKLGPASMLFADDEPAATDFLDAINRLAGKPPTAAALYLHLDTIGEAPNLRTNADVKRVLPADAYQALCRFLNKAPRPSPVLFSLPVAGQRVFGGWVHQQFSTTVYKGPKSQKLRGQAPGFRPGHLPVEVELTTAFGGQAVDRIVVRRADGARLTDRSLGGTHADRGAVNIVGCGSVGGFLARAFSHVSPSPLRLVDSEELEVHNVPRHVCDLTSVGLNKATAVRKLLRQSDPHLQVEALTDDVREILRTGPDQLVPARLTVVAVANVAVERRVNVLARDLDLGTVAYVWIEPHAVAGHAIVVPPQPTGCFECLVDPAGAVNLHVLEHPESFTKADAGCRGSFVPYGGRDLEEFAIVIAREIASAQTRDQAIAITWLGDLDSAKSNGWPLGGSWAKAPSYSVQHQVISRRHDCPVCAA